MADSKREIERKYEATDATRLPDLTRVAGVAAVDHLGITVLDAVYYDTEDFRLAADRLTLRRRTGGSDAGWHLKFPVSSGIRDELRAPSRTPCPRTWPPSSAPGSAAPTSSPSSASAPPATSICCADRTERPSPN